MEDSESYAASLLSNHSKKSSEGATTHRKKASKFSKGSPSHHKNHKTSRWLAFKYKWLTFPWIRLPLRSRGQQGCISKWSSLVTLRGQRTTSVHFALFNREDQSDIIFLVGLEPDVWRFPCHSSVLSPVSPVFESLFCGKRVETQTLTPASTAADREMPDICSVQEYGNAGPDCQVFDVKDVTPEAFQALMKFIYTHELSLTSTFSALRVFQAANLFMVFSLSKACLEYVLHNLHPNNVLEVTQTLKNPLDITECADLENTRNEVLSACADLVDAYAERILRSDAFELLNHQTMMDICVRDSLCVSSEMTVFEAIMRWACRECRRQRHSLRPENKRNVLGDALYSVRYLTMTEQEFVNGPVADRILNDEEIAIILSIMRGNPSGNIPHKLKGEKIRTLRCFTQQNSAKETGASHPTNHCRLSCHSLHLILQAQYSSPEPERIKTNESPKRAKRIFQRLGDLFIYVFQLLD